MHRVSAAARRAARLGGLVLAAGLTAGLVAGCDGRPAPAAPTAVTNAAQERTATPKAPASTTPPAFSVTATAAPANGAHGVAVTGTFRIAPVNGTFTSVVLRKPDGGTLPATRAADGKTWTISEPLGYGKTYTWVANAVDRTGHPGEVRSSFTTIDPARQVSAMLNVGDDQTYGVAMPIQVTFSAPVTDRAAAERGLSVRTSVPVTGSWAWLNDRTADYRPQTYWQPGTAVTVGVHIYGLALGDGSYGADDVGSHFTIGRSEIVRGDTQTHRLVVIRDGRQIADYPASFGLDADPGRVTHSGTHVVMSKQPTYSMSNPKYGYHDVVVPWAVRISYNGEFIHGYEGSVWAQGKENISHGCANLSPDDAKQYYDQAMVGDPVEITGSPIPLGPADGDYYDWTMPWPQWQAMSALRH